MCPRNPQQPSVHEEYRVPYSYSYFIESKSDLDYIHCLLTAFSNINELSHSATSNVVLVPSEVCKTLQILPVVSSTNGAYPGAIIETFSNFPGTL